MRGCKMTTRKERADAREIFKLKSQLTTSRAQHVVAASTVSVATMTDEEGARARIKELEVIVWRQRSHIARLDDELAGIYGGTTESDD